MSPQSFDDQYCKYYDLLYRDKDYAGEAEYVGKIIGKYLPSALTILEYGCGSGSHGTQLDKLGFSVYGLDKSPFQIELAKSKGLSCQVADITSFKLGRTFDVCIALFHVISYLNTNDQLIQVFKNAYSHLNTKGIFIFDVWFTPAVLHQAPDIREKRVENADVEILRIATPTMDHIHNVVSIEYVLTIGDKKTLRAEKLKEVHHLRHFGIPEIKLIAAQCGFELLKAEQYMTGEVPSNQSWGVNFVLQTL